MTRKKPIGKRATRSRPVRAGRPSPRWPWLWRTVAACLLVGLSCCVGLFWWSFLPTSLGQGRAIHYQVSSAAGRFAIIDGLAEAGLVAHPLLTKIYLSLLAPTAKFSERAHLLHEGLSPRQLVARLAELDSRSFSGVTLIEGWNHQQVAKKLEEVGVCSRLAFEALVFDRRLLDSLAISADSAEGYLFPATYRFALDSDPEAVIRRLVREMRVRLAKLGPERHADLDTLGLREQDVITLASVVERETGRTAERPRIARVFLNRLLRADAGTSGRLQSDATAIYGCLIDPTGPPSCATSKNVVTPAMLRDPQNPYNTYRHPGLPPGPIANPGELALRAVLHPAEGEELYFVADGDGGHFFSADFEEHQKAVDKLRTKRLSTP